MNLAGRNPFDDKFCNLFFIWTYMKNLFLNKKGILERFLRIFDILTKTPNVMLKLV